MNFYLIFVLTVIVLEYLINLLVNILNLKNIKPELPSEFKGYYDEEKYRKSQNYLKDTTYFSLLKKTVFFLVTLFFILSGVANFIDVRIVRQISSSPVLRGLIFIGIIALAGELLNLPFSFYKTFILDEKYSFNKTTFKTFFADILKSLILLILLAGGVLLFLLWIFSHFGRGAWLIAWAGVGVFYLFFMFILPVFILPLFNKFSPLEDGELKSAITNYAKGVNFPLAGIFYIDASRRSLKSNAFFTGLGKNKRIVLFDTLIKNLSPSEITAVCAHEIGHYKKKHILKNILFSFFDMGLLFFIFSFFVNNKNFTLSFGIENYSLYVALVFFSFIYHPVEFIFSVFSNFLSRRYEYEADRFAVETYPDKNSFIEALKKLGVNNLSNLTPHPVKVFFDYSHPPLLERLEAIRNLTVP